MATSNINDAIISRPLTLTLGAKVIPPVPICPQTSELGDMFFPLGAEWGGLMTVT